MHACRCTGVQFHEDGRRAAWDNDVGWGGDGGSVGEQVGFACEKGWEDGGGVEVGEGAGGAGEGWGCRRKEGREDGSARGRVRRDVASGGGHDAGVFWEWEAEGG